jgi:Na+/melibiose symporter-like transporter
MNQELPQLSLTTAHLPIRWQPTAALAATNAAITLGWIIYRVHLVGLLTQAGFSPALAPTLLLIESILAIVVEPWAGSTSDHTSQRRGGRFYIILLGAALTALLFVLLPGLSQLVRPQSALKWWFPGVLIIWAIAISLFRSPALALLGSYATPKQLPLAASLITLAGAVASSATPLASPWLLSLGIVLSFIAAAVLLLLTVGWLKLAQPKQTDQTPDQTAVAPIVALFPTAPLRASWLVRIFGFGFAVTLAFKLAVELFPKVLKAAALKPPLFMGILFLGLAVGALVAGQLASRWGNARVVVLGLGAAAVCLISMTLVHTTATAALMAILLGFCFSLILNGVLPFALGFIPLQQMGLSVGLFFGGAAAANSLYSGVLSQSLSLPLGITLGIASLLVAGICLLERPALIEQN